MQTICQAIIIIVFVVIQPEMQKAADPADISVLFFFQLVLIFGLCTQKNVLLPVLLAPVSNDFVRTISISNIAMGIF